MVLPVALLAAPPTVVHVSAGTTHDLARRATDVAEPRHLARSKQ